jgi:hypothetical protein
VLSCWTWKTWNWKKVKLNRAVLRETTVTRLTGRHFGSYLPMTERGKRGGTKMCRVCYARGLRTNTGKQIVTVKVCKTCPDSPGLHRTVQWILFANSLQWWDRFHWLKFLGGVLSNFHEDPLVGSGGGETEEIQDYK